jgi:hypothetical protein
MLNVTTGLRAIMQPDGFYAIYKTTTENTKNGFYFTNRSWQDVTVHNNETVGYVRRLENCPHENPMTHTWHDCERRLIGSSTSLKDAAKAAHAWHASGQKFPNAQKSQLMIDSNTAAQDAESILMTV